MVELVSNDHLLEVNVAMLDGDGHWVFLVDKLFSFTLVSINDFGSDLFDDTVGIGKRVLAEAFSPQI